MKIPLNNFAWWKTLLFRERRRRKIPRLFETIIPQLSRVKISRISFSMSWKKREISFSGKLDGDKKRKKHFQTTLFALFRAFQRREWYPLLLLSASFCAIFVLPSELSHTSTRGYIKCGNGSLELEIKSPAMLLAFSIFSLLRTTTFRLKKFSREKMLLLKIFHPTIKCKKN